VTHCLEVTHRLGGAGYVLWGGREGYETLLNTDLRREDEQLARFFHLVVEHKHRIGFPGAIFIEPKPSEPTKHQYDRDAAAVHAFLVRHDLAGEVLLNLEVNHATLAGLSFHHEVAYSVGHGLLGSIDANRGDPQNGWDTDQFPEQRRGAEPGAVRDPQGAGGLTAGGFNFDTKLRRQSVDRADLLHGHVGGIDTLAKSLLVAASLLEGGELATRSPTGTPVGRRSSVSGSSAAGATWRRSTTSCSATTSTRHRRRGARSGWRTSSNRHIHRPPLRAAARRRRCAGRTSCGTASGYSPPSCSSTSGAS
jgi:xylose isomerase